MLQVVQNNSALLRHRSQVPGFSNCFNYSEPGTLAKRLIVAVPKGYTKQKVKLCPSTPVAGQGALGTGELPVG